MFGSCFKKVDWCWKRVNRFMLIVMQKGSLFRLLRRLYHVMLDIILIIYLVVIVVAWLVSNDWECLMCLWKNHAFFFILEKHIIVVFSFDALFGLTWHMLTPCLTLNQSRQASMIICFWHMIPLYALVNNVLSLRMIMAVIALLVGCSQSFASIHLYWEGILLVHPTPKTKVFPKSPLQIPMHGISNHSK
jgi:hypothetical protein